MPGCEFADQLRVDTCTWFLRGCCDWIASLAQKSGGQNGSVANLDAGSSSSDWLTESELRAVHALLIGLAVRISGNYRARVEAQLSRTKIIMSRLFQLFGSVRRDAAVENWMDGHPGELGEIARHWFEVIRHRGHDVRELLHDGHPTACARDGAFAYVNVFTSHVNVGFFQGAELADPKRLLEGAGKFMRHVKLRPGDNVNAAALTRLIDAAYTDIKERVQDELRNSASQRAHGPRR